MTRGLYLSSSASSPGLVDLTNPFRANHRLTIQLFLLAAGTVALLFLWQGREGFNLWDEGYLWYGAQRVMAGDVPIRDFDAYDPGRYYWSAGLMALWGANGVIALRGAVAIFQAIGLFIALMLLDYGPTKPNRPFWVLATVTLVVWMFPRHKLFDISLSIALIGVLTLLLQQPSRSRYFLTGLVVGLVAVFGRNHGVYGVVGSLCTMAYLAYKREDQIKLLKHLVIFASGVVVGYAPVLLMTAVIPGFAAAFLDKLRYLFELGETNLPLPVPWPWLVSFGRVPAMEAARGLLVGLFFISLIAFGVLGIAWVFWQKAQSKSVSPVLAASAFLTLPYAHFAYSRAEIGHLAQGIFPFLIGALVLLANQPERIKWPLISLLCGSSLLVMLPLHPGWQCFTSQRCVEANVAQSKLRIDPGTANDLAILHKLADRFAPGNRSFIAAPYWPGAYAELGRKSPMWDIYALQPRREAFQRAEIDQIRAANPGFAIILDIPLDGWNELRFSNTNPLIDQYVRDHFEPLDGYTQDPSYHIYKSK